MKILILKIIKQIIFRYKEHTPPNVKYSARNAVIAGTCSYIDSLILHIKNGRLKQQP